VAAAADAVRAQLPHARIDVRMLDLADLPSVASFTAAMASQHGRLDVLVNNAGIMAVDQARTVDGFEMQFGVNHLGHFALTGRLLPMLLATPGSRVATMSSMGHRAGRLVVDDLMFERRGYARWGAYFASKLANLLFTAELLRRLAEAGPPRSRWPRTRAPPGPTSGRRGTACRTGRWASWSPPSRNRRRSVRCRCSARRPTPPSAAASSTARGGSSSRSGA
jgi:hypothetical protein